MQPADLLIIASRDGVAIGPFGVSTNGEHVK